MTMLRTLDPNGAVPTVPGTLACRSGRMRCWAKSANRPSPTPFPVSTRYPMGTLPASIRMI